MSENFAFQIGQRLHESRQLLGLSQAELAEAAGVSREQWGRYERGLGVPGGDVLSLAARVGVDVRYVLTGSRDYLPPPPLSAEEQTLIERWREASREVKNAAMGALLGADASRGARQMFAGKVGHVTQGDAHFSGGKFVVHDERRTVYGPASKTPAKKAPKKP